MKNKLFILPLLSLACLTACSSNQQPTEGNYYFVTGRYSADSGAIVVTGDGDYSIYGENKDDNGTIYVLDINKSYEYEKLKEYDIDGYYEATTITVVKKNIISLYYLDNAENSSSSYVFKKSSYEFEFETFGNNIVVDDSHYSPTETYFKDGELCMKQSYGYQYFVTEKYAKNNNIKIVKLWLYCIV